MDQVSGAGEVPGPGAGVGRRGLAAWAWALVGVAPFYAILAFHALAPPAGSRPTGFVQYDQPYYIANGRAVFERGNGFAGPNPYDPASRTPAIYFHWLTWLMGLVVVTTGVDPGQLYAGLGIVAGLVMARLTLALVGRCGLGGRPAEIPAYLLAMWGGGVGVLATLALGRLRGVTYDLLALDPERGWWLPSWGRNVVFSTEAIYHSMMAGAWLAALSRRWGLALALVGLLASTHPFSGLEALGIFLAWSAWGWRARLGEPPAWFVRALGVLAAAFVAYYFGFLPNFPEHRALRSNWTWHEWKEGHDVTLALYTPVAALAILRLHREHWRPGRDLSFLLTCAGVCFLLAHHDWFIKASQPLHFGRGYGWLALFLIGAPALGAAWDWSAGRPVRRALLGLVGLVACIDNAIWLREVCPPKATASGIFLPDGARAAFRAVDRAGATGLLLCDDAETSYLAATYARCRPAFGHIFNTPFYYANRDKYLGLFRGTPPGPWFDAVDLILKRDTTPLPEAIAGTWELLYHDQGWSLYRRPAHSGPN